MSHRRRRSSKRKRVNRGLVIAQILFLTFLLVFVLFFRGHIGGAASAFVDAMSDSEDIKQNK